MSEVNTADGRIIDGPQDVWPLYVGAGRENSKTGVETELAFFDPASPDLAIMSVAQNKAVLRATNTTCGGDFARNEPTSDMLEVGSIAVCPKSLREVINNLNRRIECLTRNAAAHGLKRSYFQHLPEKPAGLLLSSLMDVPRYQAMWGPPREDMQGEAAYFSVCKSNQVSVSYFDSDHALENMRRLYCLAPLLFMISENTAPFDQGQPFKHHQGMTHRLSLGARGGVPEYMFRVKTGEELINAHIEAVLNNPLFFYYDRNGDYIRLPAGQFVTFNELKVRELNTAGNYFFAQSVLWPDVKIAALKDDDGQVNGHRFEARMFGVGLHQHQTMLLLTAALAYDPAFAHDIDALLHSFGFDQTRPETLRAPLMAAYTAAREHNGRFLDIPYGNATQAVFAHALAERIEGSNVLADFADDLAPLLTVLRTGWTDSKVNAAIFPTLASALDFQRAYNAEIFKNPRQCAYDVFHSKLFS